ncbi:hypothetical protein D3C81_1841960 [compost metagenome]
MAVSFDENAATVVRDVTSSGTVGAVNFTANSKTATFALNLPANGDKAVFTVTDAAGNAKQYTATYNATTTTWTVAAN